MEWIYYRENYTFSRIQTGSTIFQGDGGPTFLKRASFANFYRKKERGQRTGIDTIKLQT